MQPVTDNELFNKINILLNTLITDYDIRTLATLPSNRRVVMPICFKLANWQLARKGVDCSECDWLIGLLKKLPQYDGYQPCWTQKYPEGANIRIKWLRYVKDTLAHTMRDADERTARLFTKTLEPNTSSGANSA